MGMLLLEQKETLEKQLADVQSQYDAAKADIELANKVGNFVDFYKENDNFPDPEWIPLTASGCDEKRAWEWSHAPGREFWKGANSVGENFATRKWA